MTIQWHAEAIWEQVAPSLPGFSVEILPEIDSTNSELMRRARAGQTEPVLLVAEHQTAGRGRLGRLWMSASAATGKAHFAAGPPQDALNRLAVSPASEKAPVAGSDPLSGGSWGLTFSLGLSLRPSDWSGLSLAVGLSLAQSLHPEVRLKWPNDLWWQERKLGGILIETASVGDLRYAVIGVGINIVAPDGAGLRTPPTGLNEILPGVAAPEVLQRVIAPLMQCLARFESEGFAPLRPAYHARDLLYGREVECSDGLTGTARGVDAGGSLLVHTAHGLKKISSAEVSVRPLPDSPPS